MYASARLPRRLGSRALGGVPGVYCFPCDAFEDIASSDVVEFALPAVLGTRFPGSGAVYSAFHDPKCALPFGVHRWGTFIDRTSNFHGSKVPKRVHFHRILTFHGQYSRSGTW